MLYVRRDQEGLMLAIRLPEEIEKRLTVLAKETGGAKTFHVRGALPEYLDIEDISLAEKRLTDIRTKRSKLII